MVLPLERLDNNIGTVQVAEYAVAQDIDHEVPAIWWTPNWQTFELY